MRAGDGEAFHISWDLCDLRQMSIHNLYTSSDLSGLRDNQHQATIALPLGFSVASAGVYCQKVYIWLFTAELAQGSPLNEIGIEGYVKDHEGRTHVKKNGCDETSQRTVRFTRLIR